MNETILMDPLRIDEVAVPGTGGALGIAHCPGKNRAAAPPGTSRRDLAADLATIRDWGAAMLLSLIEESEYAEVGVADIGARMPAGIEHLRLPIRDVSVPSAAWERLWEREGPRVRELLRAGGKVCVHCMGGLGRSGLVAARILVEFGLDPEAAIASVRRARPGAIETEEQEAYVRACLRRKAP